MSLAWPLLIGLVLSPLLGGSWSLLGRIRLRAAPVFYVAIGLQIAAFPFHRLPWRTPDRVAIGLWLASYALFALALALNARLPGVPFIAVGLVSNVAAILANGGRMPALPSALRAAGLHFTVNRNSARLSHPHLPWLVDRWAAPHWVPWGNVFSVGDVLIAVGGFLFVLGATGAVRLQVPALPRRVTDLWPSSEERAPAQPTTGPRLRAVDSSAVEQARERPTAAAAAREQAAAMDAALERARAAVEELTVTAAELQSGLPEAIQDVIREQFRPSARQLAETRGLMNQVLRRLERIECDLLAERNARADDLGGLADLIDAGRRSVDERLTHLEEGLRREGAVVYRLEGRHVG